MMGKFLRSLYVGKMTEYLGLAAIGDEEKVQVGLNGQGRSQGRPNVISPSHTEVPILVQRH
jgi:hypothetical protein